MATKDEIESFLKQLHDKMKVFDVAFRPRDKNLEAIAVLDILPLDRINYLKNLKVEDYFTGPNKDTYDGAQPDYYEFGISINEQKVYIKISLGRPNKMIDCMSFHIAAREITYPFKPDTK